MTRERPYFEIQLLSNPAAGFAIVITTVSVLLEKFDLGGIVYNSNTVLYTTFGVFKNKDVACGETMPIGKGKAGNFTFQHIPIPGICVDFEKKLFHIFKNRKYVGSIDFPCPDAFWKSKLVPGLTFSSQGNSMKLTLIGKPPTEVESMKLLPVMYY